MSQVLAQVELNPGNRLSPTALESCLAAASTEREKGRTAGFHFDLSRVLWFDIGSLLFLVCVLSELKRGGAPVLLTLPERDGRWDEGPVRMPRDFLKRWRFEEALREAVGDFHEILPARQERYFELDLRSYRPARVDTGDAIEELLSNRLVEITHMTRGPVGGRRVSEEAIDRFLTEMALEHRFREAVCGALGVAEDAYREFGGTIIREALLNTYEHPEASLSMVAMAKQARHLVVAVADNGETIPHTIGQVFDGDNHPPEATPSGQDHDLNLLDLMVEGEESRRTDLIRRYLYDYEATDYATRPGTTSRKDTPRWRRGFGLTYVRDRTLELGGMCDIRAGAMYARYYGESGVPRRRGRAVPFWHGNLVKVFIPLAKPQGQPTNAR